MFKQNKFRKFLLLHFGILNTSINCTISIKPVSVLFESGEWTKYIFTHNTLNPLSTYHGTNPWHKCLKRHLGEVSQHFKIVLQNCCFEIIVIFVQANIVYHIFTRNLPYYGGGLSLPFHNHYTTAYCPSMFVQTQQPAQWQLSWPGFEPRTGAHPWSGGKRGIH